MIDWSRTTARSERSKVLFWGRVRLLAVVLSSILLLGWLPPPYIVFLVNQTSSPLTVHVRLARYPATPPEVVAAKATSMIYRGNYSGGSCSHKPESPDDMVLEIHKGEQVLLINAVQFRQVATWDDTRAWSLRVDEGGVGQGAARLTFAR